MALAAERQYCTLEVSALWGDEESISYMGLAAIGRHRYTPYGQTWQPFTELVDGDSCDFDEYFEKELDQSRLSYSRLFEELARLGLEGWELFSVSRGCEVEDWTEHRFWFRRPVED